MTSKTGRPCIAVVAALLCATTASAQENRGTPEQRAACDARRLQALRGLHSRSHQGRALPEAEQVRSQRHMPIGFEQSAGPVASGSK
jgi:hypothetical protein